MIIAAVLLAAQPAPLLASLAQADRASPEAQVLALYDAVCVRSAEAPAGFQPVEWSSFPAALRLLNTYGHEGAFLRGEVDGRVLYAASTTGPGRDAITSGERRCGVAIRGANYSRIVRTLAGQLRVRPMEMNMVGHKVAMLRSPQGVLSVNEADDGWTIVRAYDVTFRQ
jgi:hypothetical protein